MGPDWQERVSELFHAALQRAPGERGAFLRDVCSCDEALREEIESLLLYASGSERFLEDVAGRAAVTPGAGFVDGRLGFYEITARLGAGGMGEVYRARDTRLGRDVAIKILPSHFTTDRERRARFAREARLLATLNHPNIGAIYGVEEAGGLSALVLELIEGETLADHLARGPLPIPRALEIARQVVAALEAAHEKGIVHRDLKPANIVLQATGGGERVRVLDFSLAKTMTTGSAGSSIDSFAGTADGRILGTPAYMSPEQARGLPVDTRTDIWTFGCVLFEMLSGRPPFEGNTIADTFVRVLECQPDWIALPADTPPPIRTLLEHCVRKEPAVRLQNIADAGIQLEAAANGVAGSNVRTSAGVRRSWTAALRALVASAQQLRGHVPLPAVGGERVANAEASLSKARFLMDARLTDWIEESCALIQHALADAPTLASAHVAMSQWYVYAAVRGQVAYETGFLQATRHAQEAVRLAPASAEAMGALGRAYYARRLFGNAERSFQRAIELDPPASIVLGSYSELLSMLGRHTEALELVDDALEREPMSGLLQEAKACVLLTARDFSRCVEWCDAMHEVTPKSSELAYMSGISLLMLGGDEAAQRKFTHALAYEPSLPMVKVAMSIASHRMGQPEARDRVLQEIRLRHVDPVILAEFHASVGNVEEALDSLEAGFQRDSPHLIGIAVNPLLDAVRGHSRFRRLVAALQLDRAAT